MNLCPCGSQRPLTDCCQPLLDGQRQAETPEQLMRSRFSAFVLHRWSYLLATWHPEHKPACSEAELAAEAAEGQWLKLIVLASSQDGDEGRVRFCAWYRTSDGIHLHHEDSAFHRVNGAWQYTLGQFLPAPAEFKIKPNEPCPCGSGKKYKKCCGKSG